jgi:hypothetical protein
MIGILHKLFERKPEVSFDQYRRLLDAESYGAASSMGGLHTSLRQLLDNIGSGRNLVIDRGEHGLLTIGSRHEFLEWVKSDFPDAHEVFFKRDGG